MESSAVAETRPMFAEEAVRAVIEHESNRVWQIGEIVDCVDGDHDVVTVAIALATLTNAGAIVRTQPGRYRSSALD